MRINTNLRLLFLFVSFTFLISPSMAEDDNQSLLPTYVSAIAWSHDGTKIAVGYGTDSCHPDHPEFYDIHIFDVQTNQLIQTLTGNTCYITSIEWNLNDTQLLVATLDEIGIRIWNTMSGEITATWPTARGALGAQYTSNENIIIIITHSGRVEVIDIINDLYINNGLVRGTDIDVTSDGNKLASVDSYEDLVYIMNLASGEELYSFQETGAGSVSWSPNGNTLAIGGDFESPKVYLHNALTGDLLHILEGHTDSVVALSWSPDSSLLASAGHDNTLRVWDVTTGIEVFVIQHSGRVNAVDWSPDGARIAYGGINGALEIVTLSIEEDEVLMTDEVTITIEP